MKKAFKKDLRDKGYENPMIVYDRLDTHSISYQVYLDEDDESDSWDGHYFVGEEGSKEWMIEDWNNFLNTLESLTKQ